MDFGKMFFWFGINLFDAKKYEYGGFNHFIAGKIFRWKLCYLTIELVQRFDFKKVYENDECYYDGYHNYLHIGFVLICFGT